MKRALRLEPAARRPGARPRRRITSVEKEDAKFVLRERRGCRGDSQEEEKKIRNTDCVCSAVSLDKKNPSKKEKKRQHKAGLQRAEERSPEWGKFHKMGAAAATETDDISSSVDHTFPPK